MLLAIIDLHHFYTDGQKIAKKLAVSISKEVKRVKHFLEDYNASCHELCEHYYPVPLSEVLSVGADFWAPSSSSMSDSTIPWRIKKDIMQAYLLMHRSNEEMKLLQADMHATVYYWHDKFQCISRKIRDMNSESEEMYERGSICYLRQLCQNSELQWGKAILAFGSIIEVPSELSLAVLPTQSYSDEESSDSEIDSDSNDEGI